jgi:hypothetical protein
VCVWVHKARRPESVLLCFSAFSLLGVGEALGSGHCVTVIKGDGGWGLRVGVYGGWGFQ